MPAATVKFHSIIQDLQDYECFDHDEDRMVSAIWFALEVGGKKYDKMQVEVCHPYGANVETAPLEVSPPAGGYPGFWNYKDFSDLCEKYYRSLIGSSGRGVDIGGEPNTRMRNNQYHSDVTEELQLPEEGADG